MAPRHHQRLVRRGQRMLPEGVALKPLHRVRLLEIGARHLDLCGRLLLLGERDLDRRLGLLRCLRRDDIIAHERLLAPVRAVVHRDDRIGTRLAGDCLGQGCLGLRDARACLLNASLRATRIEPREDRPLHDTVALIDVELRERAGDVEPDPRDNASLDGAEPIDLGKRVGTRGRNVDRDRALGDRDDGEAGRDDQRAHEHDDAPPPAHPCVAWTRRGARPGSSRTDRHRQVGKTCCT